MKNRKSEEQEGRREIGRKKGESKERRKKTKKKGEEQKGKKRDGKSEQEAIRWREEEEEKSLYNVTIYLFPNTTGE